jgi:hypothetical protein
LCYSILVGSFIVSLQILGFSVAFVRCVGCFTELTQILGLSVAFVMCWMFMVSILGFSVSVLFVICWMFMVSLQILGV